MLNQNNPQDNTEIVYFSHCGGPLPILGDASHKAMVDFILQLPNGGGEPGKAYMAFINAAYKKDHTQMCKLMTETADMDACLQQEEAMDWYIAMFTHPKSHEVLGGSMKGQEATLNVAYTFASEPQSTGFVVMKQMKEKWAISSFGGSGSVNVSVGVSGQADLGSSSVSGSASVGESPGEFAIINISANTKEYTGRYSVFCSWLKPTERQPR